MNNKDIDKSSVALYLNPKARKRVFYACVLILLYMTSSRQGLNVLQTPMLKNMGMLEHFSIVAIVGTIGMTIMTPVGGKIGDMIGRRNTILICGVVSIVGTIILALFQQFTLYITLRGVLALVQGVIASIPYILVGQIFPREQSPKYMGILSSAMAIGQFSGAWIAGILADFNLSILSIVYPLIFIILAMVFVVGNLPNILPKSKIKFDIPGMILLIITLTSLVLALNYGTILGWTDPKIIAAILIFVVSLVIFVKVEDSIEKRGESPLIAISLFRNVEYSVLLIVGLTAYYYLTLVLTYGPFAAINILGSGAGTAGSLTMPRTIITMILPAFTGAWVGKKASNNWKAMAIGTGLTALALIPVARIGQSSSIMILYICFAITGIAETFRSVSVTPAAQKLLSNESLPTGTALVNFVNTLSGLISAAVGGSLLGYAKNDIVLGVRLMFMSAVIVSLIGFLLTIFYIRPKQIKRAKEESGKA